MQNHTPTIYEKYIKRLLDIIISLTALILLSPIFLVVAILVRAKLGSPVIFHQQRPGYHEKIFGLCKFRSMTDERDDKGELLPDEVRLTKFGRTLRATSLDELPELWNILKGDMSLIGPRPLLVSYLPYYTDEERLRHSVRPGLTGLAQVRGRNLLDWDRRFAADVEYVKNLTFRMDVKIFFLTIRKVLVHEDIEVNTNQTEGNFAEIRKAKQKRSNHMNLLILSCGTRDKVVQYFKKAFAGEGRVVCTDCSPYAPALYEADAHYIVPRITEAGYLEVIYEICRKEEITGVLSLIDPELSLIAAHQAEFQNLGVTIIGSDFECCERTLDKWSLYCWLKEHGYPCAKTYLTMEAFQADLSRGEITFPVFVKPRKGSASIQIAKAEDMETASFLFSHGGQQMIIQEYMTGQEIGADVYIDLISQKVVSIFTKKKLVMRAGETDKAISFIDEALFEQINRFVTESGFAGQIDIDIFAQNGVYYFSEVNPRFGGGYPHAYVCGADHMTLIKNNLLGIENPVRLGGYQTQKVMMKYNEIMLTDEIDAKGNE